MGTIMQETVFILVRTFSPIMLGIHDMIFYCFYFSFNYLSSTHIVHLIQSQKNQIAHSQLASSDIWALGKETQIVFTELLPQPCGHTLCGKLKQKHSACRKGCWVFSDREYMCLCVWEKIALWLVAHQNVINCKLCKYMDNVRFGCSAVITCRLLQTWVGRSSSTHIQILV